MRDVFGVQTGWRRFSSSHIIARAALTLLIMAGLAAPAAAIDCGAMPAEAKFSEAMALCDTGNTARSGAVHFGAGAQDGPSSTSIIMSNTSNRATPVKFASARGRTAARLTATIRTASVAQPVYAPAVYAAAYRSAPIDPLVSAVGQRFRVDPRLLAAMVRTESAGRMNAVSSKGALGLMQVMPATARSLGVEPSALLADRELALSTGALYLKTLQARLGNNVPLVVAAYNAGPGAVMRAGMRIPGYRETQGYVGQVMGRYIASATVGVRAGLTGAGL